MIVTEHSRLTLRICIAALAVTAISLAVLVGQLVSAIWSTSIYYEEDELVAPAYLSVESDYEWSYPWQELGYSNIMDYHNDLLAMQLDSEGIADAAIAAYSSVITDEEKDCLYSLEKKMTSAPAMSLYDSYLEEFDKIVADCESRMPVVSSESGSSDTGSGSHISSGSGLTESGGVYYFNGRRETYYSSNALYHYRTSEWTLDSEGFYRTDEGYYVVAASDMEQGTTFEGSKGTCIVLDSGCAAGTTDYYVGW